MQPWKEFSTKQSSQRRLSAYGRLLFCRDQQRSRARSVRRAIAHARHRHAYRRFMLRAHRSRLNAHGHTSLSAYCAAAFFVPPALAFVPLALYDCTRCVHRADVCVSQARSPAIAIVAYLMRATMPPLSTASLLCSATAACVLSVRTSTTLTRQRIAWSTRDALAPRRFHFAKGIATFETRSIRCRQ